MEMLFGFWNIQKVRNAKAEILGSNEVFPLVFVVRRALLQLQWCRERR
jgi:hypothetical protein